jgi:hypothetical protein
MNFIAKTETIKCMNKECIYYDNTFKNNCSSWSNVMCCEGIEKEVEK